MMVQMLFVLSVLYVVVMSDQVSLTATIPPGYALQDYLCSGPLMSNTTVVLEDGEHRIPSGPLCKISNEGNIAITGSSNTTVRCEGEGTVFAFMSSKKLTIERITFINCGIHLVSVENILITNCTFEDSANTAIFSESSTNITIAYCLFIANGGGAVWWTLSTGDVSIKECTFQSNSANGVGGGVLLYGSTGDVSITNCAFHSNSAVAGGGVCSYQSTGDVSITNCTFQNNSATVGGGGGVLFFLNQQALLASKTAYFRITVLLVVIFLFVVVVWPFINQQEILASLTAHFRITALLVLLLVVVVCVLRCQ